MQLIQREGVQVIYPQNQTCCGQPAFNAGYRKQALKVARAQIACFPKDIPIIVPSASCTGMFTQHWRELFKGEVDEEQALAIATRVYELTEFLVNHLDIKLQDIGEPTKITLHHSCSARRESQVSQHMESLVNQLNNIRIFEHPHAEECCGFGGTFMVKQAALSGAMVESKTNDLRASGAQLVVSQDSGCIMNIDGAFKKQGNGLESQHIAEFLWQRTKTVKSECTATEKATNNDEPSTP